MCTIIRSTITIFFPIFWEKINVRMYNKGGLPHWKYHKTYNFQSKKYTTYSCSFDQKQKQMFPELFFVCSTVPKYKNVTIIII